MWLTILWRSFEYLGMWEYLVNFGTGQFKYGRNFKGKVVYLIPRYFGTSGTQCFHQHNPLSLITKRMPLLSISVSFYLTDPSKHTQTHSSFLSISLILSPVNHPLTPIFGWFHQRILLETSYALLSQTLKVKL